MEEIKKPAQEIKKVEYKTVEEKERRVVELKEMGLTFDAIAKEVGYANASGAWHAFERYMERYNALPVERLRQVQGLRLNKLMMGIWTKALRGDPDALDAALKIMKREASLFGLDAPSRSESMITIDDGRDDLDEQVRRFAYLIAEARENNGVGHNSGGAIGVGSDGAIESNSTDVELAELVDPLGSRVGEDEMRGGVGSLGSVEAEENPMGGNSENA